MPQCQNDEYLLRIYSEDEDGIITDRVDLTDSKSYGVGPDGALLAPPPQKVVAGANSAYRHGHDVVRARYDNSRVEIRNLTIMGTRPEILAQRIQRITTLLEKARYRQERGWGERVYVERDWRHSTYYSWDVDPAAEYFYEAATVLRKEVLRGEFSPPRENVTELIAAGMLGNCRLNLECYPFWQGLQQNVWTNRDVDNYYCGAYPPSPIPYLDLLGTSLPGDAPCLIRLRVENESSSISKGIRYLRVGIKQRDGPTSFIGVFQLEESASLVNDTALVACTPCACSGGVRVTPSSTTRLDRIRYELPPSELPPGTYRAFVRIRNNDLASTLRAQLRVYDTDWGTNFYAGSLATMPPLSFFIMLDLGVFEIPAVRAEGHEPRRYTLQINTQPSAINGGTFTHDMDYIMLLPVEAGVKLVEIEGAGLPAIDTQPFEPGDILEFNGFTGPPLTQLFNGATLVLQSRASDDLGFLAYLEPGQDHRFFFSADTWEGSGHNDLTQTFKVSLDVIPQYMYIR